LGGAGQKGFAQRVQVVVTGYAPLDWKGHGESGLVIGRQRSIGSGVIIDSEGYIMTNAHVVGSGGRLQVVLPPAGDTTAIPAAFSARGQVLAARVVGIAREIDLAFLKVEATGLPALPIGRYSNLRQGEVVFAFGSPEGLRNSVTMGVVSSVARQLDPDSPLVFIQTDAPINLGNSGGPLVNADGELAGLSTFILTQSGGSEGLGFAIPSGLVAFAYPQLRKYGHIHRGETGVMVQTVTPSLGAGLKLSRDWGVIVSDVLPGSPAEAAGLKVRDIVLSVDGHAIDSLPIFAFNLFTRPPGEKAHFEVLRDAERVSLEIPVAERPHDVDSLTEIVDPQKNLVAKLGILAVEIDARIARLVPKLRQTPGVIVVAKSAAADWTKNSLTTGDVIHALNGAPVSTLASLEVELEKLKPGDPLVVKIERAQRLMYLTLQLE
jgi:serine protease Do